MAKNTNEEKDDFWNLEKLVPRKKASLSQFSSGVYTSEIRVGGTDETLGKDCPSERKLTFDRSCAVEQTEEYESSDSLIKRVRVIRGNEKFDFYESFRTSASLYLDKKGKKCDFVQFYSFMPQHSQLTRSQRDYYFYWRGEFREGRYIKTDYSYMYLYVYEIINLPDKIPSEEGLALLVRLWKSYRRELPRLDMYFSMWVADYCLVHRLKCPMEEISEFVYQIIPLSNFKEFYFCGLDFCSGAGITSMLAALSDYDWRRGKYASGGDAEGEERIKLRDLYRLHIEGAAYQVLRFSLGKYLSDDGSGRKTVKRAAFPNLLCTRAAKCRLEIEYLPLDELLDLRVGITAAVRYTENKLRALLGAKSRILVKDLPDEFRKIIDLYFDGLDLGCAEKRKRALPEYERLYDAPREALSFEGADEIERASWDVTARLVSDDEELEEEHSYSSRTDLREREGMGGASGDADGFSTKAVDSFSEARTDAPSADGPYGLRPEELEFLRRLLDGGQTLGDGLTSDAVADRINEAFADGFGDVVLEKDGDAYRIIDDYIEDVKDLIL